MPFDLETAASITTPYAGRQAQTVRTLLDTSHKYDAGLCGCDGPTEPEEGGVRVMFDGRHSIPSVEIALQDGQIVGLAMIRQVRKALEDAEKLAARMAGEAA